MNDDAISPQALRMTRDAHPQPAKLTFLPPHRGHSLERCFPLGYQVYPQSLQQFCARFVSLTLSFPRAVCLPTVARDSLGERAPAENSFAPAPRLHSARREARRGRSTVSCFRLPCSLLCDRRPRCKCSPRFTVSRQLDLVRAHGVKRISPGRGVKLASSSEFRCRRETLSPHGTSHPVLHCPASHSATFSQ